MTKRIQSINNNNNMSEILSVVLALPSLMFDETNYRYELLFSSIASLSNYTLYILNSRNANRKFIELAHKYIDPLRIEEINLAAEILINPEINKILMLELNMFIQHPLRIYDSPRYVSKMELCDRYRSSLLLPNMDPYELTSHPIVNIPNIATAEIYLHNYDRQDILRPNIINRSISCILTVTEPKLEEFYRSLTYYLDQTYKHCELIIVANNKCQELLSNISQGSIRVLFHDGSVSSMNNCGIKAAVNDYVILWNLNDWYHPSFLSIIADKLQVERHEYLNFSTITGFNGTNFVTSQFKANGWEETLIMKRSLLTLYSEGDNYLSQHMKEQWENCSHAYIFDPEYSGLYIKMQYTSDSTDVILPAIRQRSYKDSILSSEPIKTSLPTLIIINPSPINKYWSKISGLLSWCYSWIPSLSWSKSK